MIGDLRITEVWERLGGGPIRNGRAAAWWRDGDGANIAIDRERGVWFDFARGFGGGVLDLVRTVCDCDKRAAVHWLRDQGLIEDDPYVPPAEGRRRAQQRARLDALAKNIGWWWRGRVSELERLKADALIRGDEAALAISARELFCLQSDGVAVVTGYRAHTDADPDGAGRLIEWAREDDLHAQRLTAVAVLMLARARSSRAGQ
jgi:hypothetical protein